VTPNATQNTAGAAGEPLLSTLWSMSDVLFEDGLSTIEYVEQLSYLLFLKIADEQCRADLRAGPECVVPEHVHWRTLLGKWGPDLDRHYRRALADLGSVARADTTGTIFAGAQHQIKDMAKLRRLIELIDEKDWTAAWSNPVGALFEDSLAILAEDIKAGAHSYFTPRALVDTIVEVTRPTPQDTIVDPACGTGGFLIAAHAYIVREYGRRLPRSESSRLSSGAIRGIEQVQSIARLAAMNLMLHGLGSSHDSSLVHVRDALAETPEAGDKASLVLVHPPFGRRSPTRVYGADGRFGRRDFSHVRRDFGSTTSNRSLKFLQHAMSLMAVDGRAAVVVPDNVLYEGGAGEAIRRRLLKDFDVHTLLRLPSGALPGNGVMANVLFFDKPDSHRPDDAREAGRLWIYDLRTGRDGAQLTGPLRDADFDDFIHCCLPGRSRRERTETERFKAFAYDELLARNGVGFDITRMSDGSNDEADDDASRSPAVIAREIVDDLQAALDEFAAIADVLDGTSAAADVSPRATAAEW
jgi:type I restriction enzyme M protein